jgi:glycosyltransferase involved in cell wall biosynthesis
MYSDNIKLYSEYGIKNIHIYKTIGLTKVQKLLKFYELTKQVSNKMSSSDICYSFGFELTFLVRFFTKKKYIYENADVLAARHNSLILKKIDKNIIKHSVFSILTSEGFIDYFYGTDSKNAPKSKIILIPNKLSQDLNKLERPLDSTLTCKSLRFGFVGYFRYIEMYINFSTILGEKYPQHEFHFWGDGSIDDVNKIVNLSERYHNIFYHGPFVNPHDLSSIYSNIDINVVCYDTKSGNVRTAEPNKLYESIFFCKPIVVSQDTFLSKKVDKLGVGFSINASKAENIESFIFNLSDDSLYACISKEKIIKRQDLFDNNDVLVERILNS